MDILKQLPGWLQDHLKITADNLELLRETWVDIERINRLKIKDMKHLQNLCKKSVLSTDTKLTDGYIVGAIRSDNKINILDGNHRSAFYITKGFEKLPMILVSLKEET